MQKKRFDQSPESCLFYISVTVTVTVTVTRGLILHTRICAPIDDRNTTPAGTGKGARIQSR